MNCELTGIPENMINPPDLGDDDTPDVLTPSEKVGEFLSGYSTFRETFGAPPVHALAMDFEGMLDVIRHYKRESNFTDEENIREKMARINEFLDETLLEYVE